MTSSRLSWPLLLVLIGAFAWVRIFTTWFAQDDFRWLLRAAEGAPVAWTAPRVLSMSLYFRAAHALFGTQPAAYHALALALHLVTGLLIHRVLARRLAPGVAAAAAAVYLTSPALFDTLHWISGIADLLCVAWLAQAVALVTDEGRDAPRAWLAVLAYALALASKEIAVGLAPVMALLHARRGGRPGALRAVVCLALAALVAFTASGAWQTASGEPYALRPAAALPNLPAFVAASVMGGAAWAEPSDIAWARLPWVQAAGWVALAAWLVALVIRRSPAAWLGLAWFLGAISPVLMLERQLYLYYACCALPGLVASVAFLVAGPSRHGPRGSALVLAALVAAQAVAIEARCGSRLAKAPLPTDFVLRRAVIARNAIADLAGARERLGARLVLLGQQPVDAAWQGRSTTESTDYTRDPFWDENVRAALEGGEAVRLMLPMVREVTFKPWLEPEDTSGSIAPYRIDGHLTVTDYASFVGAGPPGGAPATTADRLVRAGDLIRRRLFREALDELLRARRESPDHPDVLINLGALQAHLGDSSAALASLTRALEVAPGDLDARYNLGLLLWRAGRPDQARSVWGPLLREAPASDLARAVSDLLAGRAR
jgi:tetratricopeptide (TPR) repeat protein